MIQNKVNIISRIFQLQAQDEKDRFIEITYVKLNYWIEI